jgi:hypothetical protein
MADRNGQAPDSNDPERPVGTAAELAADRFRELSAEIRGCAILASGDVLAATGNPADWAEPAAALLAAADAVACGHSSQAHVATEGGEAYAVRLAGLAMVAVTDRFTLASLVLADMRATLRDLARAAADHTVAQAAA